MSLTPIRAGPIPRSASDVPNLEGFPLAPVIEHISEHAGVTRQTVSNYIDLLVETDLVEEVPNTSPRRYRVAKSEVVQELFELNSALNVAGE